MPRLRHFDHLNHARFVTFTCFRRQLFLDSHLARDITLEHLTLLRDLSRVRIYGFVIMPEHVHLVLNPPDDVQLGRVLGLFKSESAKRIKKVITEANTESIWQNRGYDRNCRSHDEVIRAIQYCHFNPVRRHLCADPCD